MGFFIVANVGFGKQRKLEILNYRIRKVLIKIERKINMPSILYPNSPKVEYLYQLSNKLLEILLFKILRLKKHENNIGVHFFLPIRPFQLFGINLYFVRLNFIFPFFVSFSIGIEGHKGFHFYIGLKVTQSECIKWNEWDYMLSTAFRYNYLAYDKKWEHMGSL